MPTIVALVKSVPDTWSEKALEEDFTLDRSNVDEVIDEVNEFSVEQALRLREDNPQAGFRVIALAVGPASAGEAVRRAIAMGADDGIHVTDERLAGSDVLATAWTIASAIGKLEKVQLVVAGGASSDGATGALPGILAEYLQYPALTQVNAVHLDGADKLAATREDDRGRLELEAPLPAVVSVTDKADKPRFPNFKGLMTAKKHELTVWDLDAVGVAASQVGLDNAATAVTGANERAARVRGEIIRGEDAADQLVEFLGSKNFV